jgi:hypothetical protein
MRDVLVQVFANLRANKLRSFLTMFGILWGVISVVILSATGEHRHRMGRPDIAAGRRRARRARHPAHTRRCACAGA